MEMVGQGVRIFLQKFHPCFPPPPFLFLKNPNFSSFWHGSLARWPPFERSSTKTGSLDIDPVYSTLCPRITSTRSTSKFHFNTFQYSVGGAVMPDAITHGQDCIVRCVYYCTIAQYDQICLHPLGNSLAGDPRGGTVGASGTNCHMVQVL